MTTIVNPRARLKLERDNGVTQAVKLTAPIKGESLKVTTIDRTKDAELFTFLLTYSALQSAGDGLNRLSKAHVTRLAELGFLVGHDQVSEPVFYECDVDDTPLDLLPRRAREHWHAATTALGDLIIEPTLRMLGESGPTAEMRGRLNLASPFRTHRWWLSVDGHIAVPTFYSCSPDLGQQLTLLASGRMSPATLPPEARSRLLRLGVLRPAAEVAERRITRANAVAAAHRQLSEERHVLLQEVIRPMQLAAIRRYYRKLIDEGFVRFGDDFWPNRYFSGFDPLAYFFQQQLTDLICEIVGHRVKPSFSYFASYRPGSDLKPHRDREQCHYAMSVLLDHEQPDDVSSWPIYVHPPGRNNAIPVHAGLGDGLLYFGEEVLHYRYPLTEGYSTLWFLFWVPESFSGSLD